MLSSTTEWLRAQTVEPGYLVLSPDFVCDLWQATHSSRTYLIIEVLVPEIVIVPFPHASQNFLEVQMMLQT